MRLLYFSPVSAGSYAQRPHFMVRAWLAWGVESVLWVNPYPCRLPCPRDLRRPRNLDDQGTPLDARVRVLDVPALPIEPLPWGAWLNRRLLWAKAWREIAQFAAQGATILGVGRPSALALVALDELKHEASFFDAMDNFPEFHRGLSRRAMRRHENAVAARVDLVVASSTFLAEKFAQSGLRVEKVLNACELPQFSVANHHSPIINHSSPVLGYVGCIGRWFDWPLVLRLAEAMPQASVELVGPCVVPPPSGRKLPGNVRLLPACRQSEAADHLARFSAGLIPFRPSALTDGVDPIKYYDYRAAGLPVLSTRFGEMAKRGRADDVYFFDEGDGVADAAAAALAGRRDHDATNRFRRENNWTARFKQSSVLRSLAASARKRDAA